MNKVTELGPILTNHHSSMKELKKNQQPARPWPAPRLKLVYSHSTHLLQEARTSHIQRQLNKTNGDGVRWNVCIEKRKIAFKNQEVCRDKMLLKVRETSVVCVRCLAAYAVCNRCLYCHSLPCRVLQSLPKRRLLANYTWLEGSHD